MDAVQEQAITNMLERVKHALGLQDENLLDEDAGAELLRADVEAALADMARVTGGNWLPGDLPATRYYHIPPSSLRNIDDLQPDPSPSVKIYGSDTPLVAGTAYKFILNEKQTAYVQVKRLVDGSDALWDIGHEDEDGTNGIAIAGVFASTTEQQADWSRRWEALALANYRNRVFGYADSGSGDIGISTLPNSGEDLAAIGASYRIHAPRQIEPVGVD